MAVGVEIAANAVAVVVVVCAGVMRAAVYGDEWRAKCCAREAVTVGGAEVEAVEFDVV